MALTQISGQSGLAFLPYGVSPGTRAADPLVAQPSVASPGVSTIALDCVEDSKRVVALLETARDALNRALSLAMDYGYGSQFEARLIDASADVGSIKKEFGL